MRRAIQLRMTFSWGREGGIEGERRRKHDGDQIEAGVMIVAGHDHDEMEQGMDGQESRAGDRGGPVRRPPGPCRERKTSDKEGRANVLDKVRIIWTGLGHSWQACVPEPNR